MKKATYYMLLIISMTVLSFSFSFAQQDEKGGMPPAAVVVSPVKNGVIIPENEFIGTVYYQAFALNSVEASAVSSSEGLLFLRSSPCLISHQSSCFLYNKKKSKK